MTHPDDRYEPLPALPELPRWVWRRMGRPARITAVLAALAVVAGAAAVVPSLRESQQDADERIQRERAAQRAELVRRLEAEQRPVAGRSAARDPATRPAARSAARDPATRLAGRSAARDPATRLAARARVMGDVSAAIAADARARVDRGDLDGPIRRVACEPFPRSLDGRGADDDLSRRRGRYSCIAVSAEFESTRSSPGGAIGHLYRARVDFATGRYSFCKIAGRPGPEREPLVTVPRACGG